jgi:carboxyl-terminal processing protease
LSALDPYTVIVWPKQVEDFEKIMTNEFTGIGIEISKEKGLLTVASLLPDTPAYNSGLDAEDVIEKVDGVETKDMSLSCAVKNITGPAGTEVRLTIRRAGEDKTRDITITRAKITVPTIRGWQRTETGKWLYMIERSRKIGYVHITSFSEKTASDLEDVLNQLEAEGLNGLILDLRFNSGGLLNTAVEVADKFLEEGPIVITRPRSWVSSTYAWAHREGTHPNYPLVILINSYSASASEIVAGALADPLHNRASLVGERTHGKGSVQGIISYPKGGAQLKYTMAYYHLPSGQRVKSRDEVKKEGKEDWGVGPDIEVKLRSDEIKKMFDVQRDNDVLVRADHDKEVSPLKKHTAEESLSADPQLAVGLLVVKSKLIQGSSEIQKL